MALHNGGGQQEPDKEQEAEEERAWGRWSCVVEYFCAYHCFLHLFTKIC